MQIAIIGGGAAGFFAAITCAENNPACRIVIFERGKSVLEKVRISGGGRCNVTHACFDARTLTQFYPRGQRELLGPFMQFGPEQTIEWFHQRGVALKTEADGRMFPRSDDSATIVNCLQHSAKQAQVEVRTSTRVEQISLESDGRWKLQLTASNSVSIFDKIMIASGSTPAMWQLLEDLGHQIIAPVPSLFTFNTKDTRFRDLAGLSVPQSTLRIPNTKLTAQGPLLVTHWGLSGPGILRLSAWGARDLHDLDYKFPLEVNWSSQNPETNMANLQELKQIHAKKQISSNAAFGLPLRLWQNLVEAALISPTLRWADADKTQIKSLSAQICQGQFQINGKSTFKEEFVTAGGVSLKEINFKTFESKILPNLYMAGEVLDIDAITGGFNFQAAWTGGYLAGLAMSE